MNIQLFLETIVRNLLFSSHRSWAYKICCRTRSDNDPLYICWEL